MGEINLLPEELKPKSSYIKLSSFLKKFALLGVIILLFFLSASLGVGIFLDKRISVSLKNQESLKNKIKALEKTEQRIVLVKDRLEKIKSLKSKSNANDELDRLNVLSKLFPEGTNVKEVNINVDELSISVLADNLDDIALYLANVITSKEFNKVILKSLEFNLKEGYSVKLVFP